MTMLFLLVVLTLKPLQLKLDYFASKDQGPVFKDHYGRINGCRPFKSCGTGAHQTVKMIQYVAEITLTYFTHETDQAEKGFMRRWLIDYQPVDILRFRALWVPACKARGRGRPFWRVMRYTEAGQISSYRE